MFMCSIQGEILWFWAPQAKLLMGTPAKKTLLFECVCYSDINIVTILTGSLFVQLFQYYSDGILFWRARERASEKISIICTGWLFWHRIYYYSDGFAIRTFCFLLFWQNIILTGARSAPTKKWSLFARNLKTLLFVRWQVVKGGGWIVLYPW